MDVVERIFILLRSSGIEQKAFAKQIGVSPSKISEWKGGKAKSYTKYLSQIAAVLNTTTDYLLNGEEKPTAVVPELDTPGAEDAQLLRRIHALSPEARGKLLGYLDALSSV